MKQRILGAVALAAACVPGTAWAQQNSYAEDRALIENLSNHYMVAVDAGDLETVMDTWAEDGVLEWVFGVENGKEEIREAMSNFGGAGVMGSLPPRSHRTAPHAAPDHQPRD